MTVDLNKYDFVFDYSNDFSLGIRDHTVWNMSKEDRSLEYTERFLISSPCTPWARYQDKIVLHCKRILLRRDLELSSSQYQTALLGSTDSLEQYKKKKKHFLITSKYEEIRTEK